MATVERVMEQRAMARSITSPEAFRTYHSTHFDNAYFPYPIEHEIIGRHPEIAADYFRLMGLVAIVCSQYGFYLTFGHRLRSDKYGWDEPGSPRHQLALASYVGGLNMQVHPIKQRLETRLRGIDPSLRKAAWGVFFDAKDGEVINKPMDAEKLERVARDRLDDRRPISRTDIRLNRKLAAIGYTGDDVGSMPEDEFIERVLPPARHVTAGIVDDIDALMDIGLHY